MHASTFSLTDIGTYIREQATLDARNGVGWSPKFH